MLSVLHSVLHFPCRLCLAILPCCEYMFPQCHVSVLTSVSLVLLPVHVMSPVMSCHVMSPVMSCHVLGHVMSSVMSCHGHVMSCPRSCHVMSPVMSCHVMSPVMSCHVMSPVMSCHVPGHVMSCPRSCHVMSPVMACPRSWQVPGSCSSLLFTSGDIFFDVELEDVTLNIFF